MPCSAPGGFRIENARIQRGNDTQGESHVSSDAFAGPDTSVNEQIWGHIIAIDLRSIGI